MEHYHAQLEGLGIARHTGAAFSALITGYCAAGALQVAIRVYNSAVAQGAP